MMANMTVSPTPMRSFTSSARPQPAGNGVEDTRTDLVEKVVIRNLSFFYKEYEAVRGINLTLYDKQVTAFIGPSGCGKSTLLRTLNRIYDLYPGQRAEGEIAFDGSNLLGAKVDLTALRARIGMVFQKPTPFPMSIYDNVAYGVRLHESKSKSD